MVVLLVQLQVQNLERAQKIQRLEMCQLLK
jgi:hypothetical protein